MGLRVKDWRESECRFVMRRIRVETLPGAKASRLLRGLSYEKDSRTFLSRKANERDNCCVCTNWRN
jgi:hypothetical protein